MKNKNLFITLLLLSIISCGEGETKPQEEIEVVETIETITTESNEAKPANSETELALINYSLEGNLEDIKNLVESGENIHVYTTQDYEYLTPLKGASKYGHLEIVKYLVENGADIEATESMSGWSALMTASSQGNLEVIKFLVEKSANIEVKDNNGKTASMLAEQEGHIEIVEYFKRHSLL